MEKPFKKFHIKRNFSEGGEKQKPYRHVSLTARAVRAYSLHLSVREKVPGRLEKCRGPVIG